MESNVKNMKDEIQIERKIKELIRRFENAEIEVVYLISNGITVKQTPKNIFRFKFEYDPDDITLFIADDNNNSIVSIKNIEEIQFDDMTPNARIRLN